MFSAHNKCWLSVWFFSHLHKWSFVYIYALKGLSTHTCGDTLYSVTSTDIMHQQEKGFLYLTVSFQKAPFTNKNPSRILLKCLCWAESYYGPAYFPIETDKWPFDEAALWPFFTKLSEQMRDEYVGVWRIQRIKNRKRGQIIRIHPVVQWTAFQKPVPLSIQSLLNKETSNYNQMVTMAPHVNNFLYSSFATPGIFRSILIITARDKNESSMCQ